MVNDNRLNVEMYARVSGAKQSKAGTIASQIDAIQQHVLADGLEINSETHFVDDGYSGSTLV